MDKDTKIVDSLLPIHILTKKGVKKSQISQRCGFRQSNFLSRSGNQKNDLTAFALALFLLLSFSSSPAYAADNTEESKYVIFFKQTTSKPPDIERFVASRTQLLKPLDSSQFFAKASPTNRFGNTNATHFFEGALSGTNFFLHSIIEPKPSVSVSSSNGTFVVARAGATAYEIGGHGLILSIGSNAASADVEVNFQMARTILAMGTGEVAPGTVEWNGNTFRATNVVGKALHGSLQITNGLPTRMELTLDGESQPYGAVEYTYPDPPDSLNCYPIRFVKSFHSSSGLKPLMAVELINVQIAKQPLDITYFGQDRFAKLFTYTNVFSNSDYYVSKSKSKALVKANSYPASAGFTNAKSHAVIYWALCFATLLPLGIIFAWSFKKTKHQLK